jgi:regulatory protein
MTITKITEQVKNLNRVSVFVDGKYSFSLSLDQLLDLRIKVGDEVDEARLKELIKLSQVGKLKMRTLEWLMIRPHSAKELRDYLKRKKLADEEIIGLLEYFKAHNYQNDEAFARWWLEQRRAKNKSISFIKFELRTKGVDGEIIQQVIGEDAVGDKQILKQLIDKKRRQTKYQDPKKLTEFLLRQGYNYSLIKDVLESIEG